MGGGQGQTKLGAIAQEILDKHDMEKRLREEAEEREKERQRRLAWAYFMTLYVMNEQQKFAQQYQQTFDKVFQHQFPVASVDMVQSHFDTSQKFSKVMNFMDNFDKTFYLDHRDIKGIEYRENTKTFMTPEEKARIKLNSFDQRQLNTIHFAVKIGDPKANEKIAKDAIEEYAKGNKKPLANIMASAIRNNMDKIKEVSSEDMLINECATLRELLSVIEEHPDIQPEMKLTEKEMNEAYGSVSKGFLLTRGMQAKIIMQQALISGEDLEMGFSKDFKEECIRDVIAAEVIAKQMKPEQLSKFGFTVEHMSQGIVPEAFINEVTTTRNSMDVKQIDGLLLPPVLVPEEDEKKIKKEAPELEKKFEPRDIEQPVLGGNVPGLGF